MTLFEQQKAIITVHHEEDLVLLCDETDKALDVAHKRAKQELVDLQAEHKAQ